MSKFTPLQHITLRGFKSFREVNAFPLRNLNVLIGANGSGKSNFVEAFQLLDAITQGEFQDFVFKRGGAEAYLHHGQEESEFIFLEYSFGETSYTLALTPSMDGRFTFTERFQTATPEPIALQKENRTESALIGFNHDELHEIQAYDTHLGITQKILQLSGTEVFSFQHIGPQSPLRSPQVFYEDKYLRIDGINIASVLFTLCQEHRMAYDSIVHAVQMAAPFFQDFHFPHNLLSDDRLGHRKISLQWRQKGSSHIFQPWQLSDGTLRFILLATALLQPAPPSTIIIDEPELGLHPFALAVFANLVQQAAQRTQVILSTQSPSLINYFEPEDIVVAERIDGATQLRRLDSGQLQGWLEEYSLGELMEKNVLDAGPRHA